MLPFCFLVQCKLERCGEHSTAPPAGSRLATPWCCDWAPNAKPALGQMPPWAPSLCYSHPRIAGGTKGPVGSPQPWLVGATLLAAAPFKLMAAFGDLTNKLASSLRRRGWGFQRSPSILCRVYDNLRPQSGLPMPWLDTWVPPGLCSLVHTAGPGVIGRGPSVLVFGPPLPSPLPF